jgi:putative phosphoribosyl transferase
MVIVPRATHLFEEPGALAEVASHAAAWFTRHFQRVGSSPPVSASASHADAPLGTLDGGSRR